MVALCLLSSLAGCGTHVEPEETVDMGAAPVKVTESTQVIVRQLQV